MPLQKLTAEPGTLSEILYLIRTFNSFKDLNECLIDVQGSTALTSDQ